MSTFIEKKNPINPEAKISSVAPEGSGAIVVHRYLENQLPHYKVTGYLPTWEFLPLFLRTYSDPNTDIVHSVADYGLFHARKKQKLVLTLHNYVLDSYMSKYSSLAQRIHYKTDLRWLTKMSLSRADRITAVSHYVANLTRKDLGINQPIQVIYNGIDERRFLPTRPALNKKRVRVLFSGNLSVRKGAQWILPILERLDKHIDIAYTSGLRKNQKLEEHPRLIALGRINYEDMPKAYQSADILLFPTVREGFGLAAVEAMSCGLPVVASNCSAIPELVDDGKGGYLCPVGDVKGFAEKINALAASPSLRSEMGAYNRHRVEQDFTLEKMAQAYRELFSSLIR